MPSQTSSLEVIYEPKLPELPKVDIVAVHGLNPLSNPAHAKDTWTAKSTRKMWLQDFLPYEIPYARIFLFSYNSHAALETSTAGIQDQAQILFSSLLLKRTDAPERPLILISHSLGGIICKRGLTLCKLNNLLLPLYKATYGLVFFATPHRGGKNARTGDVVASIAKFVLNNPSNNYLEALKGKSYFSEILRNDFSELYEDFYFLTFFETSPMKHIGIVVERDSAVLGLPGEREIKLAIAANHSNICKFESKDGHDYKLVCMHIKDMVEKSIRQVEQRRISEGISASQASGSSKAQNKAGSHPGFPTLRFTGLIALNYVERPELFNRLNEILNSASSDENYPTVALVHGLAGSGKTQLSRSYAKKWLREHSCCYCFDASSLEILKGGFVSFIIAAGISCMPDGFPALTNLNGLGGSNFIADQFIQSSVQQAIDYISNLTQKWLLIFDNFDLPEKDRFNLRSFFPEGSNGQIIVTSRNRDVEDEIGGNALHVDRMSDDEAVRLLVSSAALRTTVEDQEEQDLKAFISTNLLGSLPLAIAQGAAFIKRRTERSLPIVQRLRQYQDYFRDHQASMLDGESGRLVILYQKSIITSWDMSFQVVISDSPTAAHLLLFMGCLHHTDIPKELFKIVHDSKEQLHLLDEIDITTSPYQWLGVILASNRYGQWDDSNFKTSIAILKSFSLIRSTDDDNYHIHPLVHTWTRVSKIGNQDETEVRAYLVLSTLAKLYKKGSSKYHLKRRIQDMHYLRHLTSCLDFARQHTEILNPKSGNKLQVASLLRIVAILGSDLLSPEQNAQKLVNRLQILALTKAARKGGFDDIQTLKSLREVLAELGGDPTYIQAIQPLVEILPALLPIAAPKDSLIQEHLGVYLIRIFILHRLERRSELRVRTSEVLEFLDNHQEALGTHDYYLRKSVIMNGLVRLLDVQELPGFLNSLEKLSSELGQDLKEVEGDHSIFFLKFAKSRCLHLLGRPNEAIGILRSNLSDMKLSTWVPNNLVSQYVTGLSIHLMREKQFSELVENWKYLLDRISKQFGSFHEEALYLKQRIIEYERLERRELGLLGKQRFSDPAIFGIDHCLQLPDNTVILTLELAIAYKAFNMDEEIDPLWNGVMKQARDEVTTADLIDLYIGAFQVVVEAAHRQGYHYYGLMFKTAIEELQLAHEKSKSEFGEPRYSQLERLNLLWGDLSLLYDIMNEPAEALGTADIGDKIIRSIRKAPNTAQPAMLSLVNHFLQWMVQSEMCSTSAPIPISVLQDLEELSTTHFGHWNDSYNTLRATVNLTVCLRLSGDESKAIEIENELLRCRVEDEKNGRRTVPGAVSRELIPSTHGIVHLHTEYRRREWLPLSVRLYELAYNDFINTFGIKAEVTLFQVKFLCLLYGQLSQFDKLEILLSRLETEFKNSDDQTKYKITECTYEATQWLCAEGVFEASWHLIQWTIRCTFVLDNLSRKIQILKDLEFLAAKTERQKEIPDIVELRKKFEVTL